MSNTADELKVVAKVKQTPVAKGEDLVVAVTFTNVSQRVVKINALFMPYASLRLRVRTIDGAPVHPGSPPLPPEDDGEEGRIQIAPGRSTTFEYRGSDYFSNPVGPGNYQVRFQYGNSVATHGDWTGTIETDWVDFEIRK